MGAHLSPLNLAQAKAMTENDLEEQVRAACKALRVRRHHSYDSRKSASGFPDDVLIGTRVLFRELKRIGNYPTPIQRETLAALVAAGADAAVWTPVEWFDGTIKTELHAISPLFSGRR